jgi:hypothetical protein
MPLNYAQNDDFIWLLHTGHIFVDTGHSITVNQVMTKSFEAMTSILPLWTWHNCQSR